MGWAEVQTPEVEDVNESLLHKLQTGRAMSMWATANTRVDDDGAYIAKAIRNREAIAVSDGSYKDLGSAAAC
eukprot:5767956-Ditylum_brightwellii.AAC.1